MATPHVRTGFLTDVSDLSERVRELRLAVDRAGLPVSLRRGGELGHDTIDEDFHAATDELRDRGFGVVIAHPERSADAILFGAEACAGRSSGARWAR